jgi:hypothetical protein
MTEPDTEDSMTHFDDSFRMTIDSKAVASHATLEGLSEYTNSETITMKK